MTSIDIREAYLHVPIRPAHRKFLRFCYNGAHFQYRALPFGLSFAPCTFTKLLDAVAAHLRARPIRLLCYLDDILILSSSSQHAEIDLQVSIRTLQEHGFTVNWDKSHLTPATDLVHLGACINTLSCLIFLLPERLINIKNTVKQVQSLTTVHLLLLSQLLGLMISCLSIVPWAQLHSRPLQWFLLPSQKSGTSASKTRVRDPHKVLASLH